MDVPVFHDDQHGTAIISGAALMNATGDLREGPLRDRHRVLGCGRVRDRVGPVLRLPRCKEGEHHDVRLSGIITEERVENGGVREYKSQFASDVDGG